MYETVLDSLVRTRGALRLARRHRGSRAVTAGAFLAYLLAYLYAIGKLRVGAVGFEVVVAAEPLDRFFHQTFGTFTYEPVVLLRLGVITYQFSLNTVIGAAIAALVAANVGLSYLAWRQPAACGVGSRSAGLVAGVPALLSGTACCAPVLALLVGLQLTGAVMLAFELMLPVAVVLLVGSLLLVGRRVDPALADRSAADEAQSD